MIDLEAFIAQAATARGFRLVKADDLRSMVPTLEERGYWITRLEASEMRGSREIFNIEFSIIGLDGNEDWENHHDIPRHTALVYRKIEEAKASGMEIEFRVWIEKD